MKKKTAVCLFLLLTSRIYLPAQVITTQPVYPIDTDSVTVFFDATQGNAGLKDVNPPIYAHTGVITNLSTSGSDWKYVIAAWNVNLPKALMTPLGNNKYKITLKPSIREFYGVPASEQILKLAFVFRNSDGSKEGKDTGGADIFADVYTSAMSVNITLPEEKNLFLKQMTEIPVSAVSPPATSMKLFVNGTLVKSVTGNTLTDTVVADNQGHNWVKNWVRIEASDNTGAVADSFSYTVIPDAPVASLPAGISDGINYVNASTVVLCLYAPGKDHVFATGDFNDWQLDSAHYMFLTPDHERFWLNISGLTPKQEYIFQYVVDGKIRIGDPYADKVSDPNDQYISPSTYPNLTPYPAGKASGIATFLQPGQDAYAWNSTPFTPPAVTDLVVYELLIRDFTDAHDYPSLIGRLDYLKDLGVNAIELMPVMEYEGNISWGYNTNYSFAVDKYYGTKEGLKQFVEAAHARGMAVILDIVCNHHFGSSPLVRLYWDDANQRPAADNPWLNPVPRHPYNVGYDFNHESQQTRQYMKRLVKYWLTEYRIDGFRFDLSKGFTQTNTYPNNVSLWGQFDASRVAILKDYEAEIHAVNPTAYMILEHLSDNPEEKELAANRMILWGNMNYKYIQGAGGWVTGSNSDYSWASWKYRGWTQPNLVAYMESHDEERVMFRNISAGNASKPPYNVRDTATGLKRVELNANFFFTIPGPKQIWQFGELGYDYSINYPSMTSASRLDPKPVRWDYLDSWPRRYTKNVFASLIALKKSQPAFATADYSIDLTGNVKRLWLKHSSMDVTVLGNFDVVTKNVTGGFTRKGAWFEYYSGDTLNVTDTEMLISFKPGEYRLYTTVKLAKPSFTGIGDDPAATPDAGTPVVAYPNPSPGIFNLAFRLDRPQTAEITVYDIFGKMVTKVKSGTLDTGVNSLRIDLNDLLQGRAPSGMYFFRFETETIQETGKLIVR